MITLSAPNGISIRLNDHLIWKDEGEYSDLAQSQEYTLTGALYIESSLKKSGRTITLSAAPNEGMKTRADWDQLRAFYEKTMLEAMVLTRHDGSQYSVTWRAIDGPPIETTPLTEYADTESNDYLGLTLRLTQLNG